MRTIVSLTSYGQRLANSLPQALESIFKMKGLNPDMVVLYLTDSDYELLDKNILFKYDKLSVRIIDDIKSYKKYYVLTESEFDDDFIFIADDDVKYSENSWQNLKRIYESNKDYEQKFICANKSMVSSGFFKPFHTPVNSRTPFDIFLFWCGNGILIPPKTMRLSENILTDGFNLSNNGGLNYVNDDIFLSVYCYKENIKCFCSNLNQRYIDFDGNKKFVDTHKDKVKTNFQLSLEYFELAQAETIVVSLTTSNYKKSYDTIVSLFSQTLKPNKVILTLDKEFEGTLTKKFLKLQNDYNFEIQYTGYDANLKKLVPDGTSDNDLLFSLDGNKTYPADFLETLFCEYYRLNNDNAISINRNLVYFEKHGHHYTINTDCAVVRQKYLKDVNLNDSDIELSVTKSVLLNHKSVQLIKK